MVLGNQGLKWLRKRDGRIGPVNLFPPRDSVYSQVKLSGVEQSKLTKGAILGSLRGKGLIKEE